MMTTVGFIPEDVSRCFYVICGAVHWHRDADDGNSCLIFVNPFSVYRASSATRNLCRNDRAILALLGEITKGIRGRIQKDRARYKTKRIEIPG
ncbi:uncharacterized protein ARMOST_06047 [Armillaria ostoyae]|uniref:Uncharacterized protein n=1 Tax=Armillaria ostoyae TaxID=47428 RepID=A0A284R200_ARMOS|nr:uncharacterized protein ARMOST_06047 [Armillaria ostoyae]